MCGIIGITNIESAGTEVFKGLLLLQHRGQDSAGIISYDEKSNRFNLHKDLGLVSNVFDSESLKDLTGSFALGHTRYSTIGKIYKDDVQPLMDNYPYGTAAVHNGNIENIDELSRNASREGRYFNTNNDLEVMMHSISGGLTKYQNEIFFETLTKSVTDILTNFKGGYSYLSIIAGRGLMAFSDQFGIRPLVLGKKNNSYLFASETNVLTFLGYEFVKDVFPGELIFVDLEGKMQSKILTSKKAKPCMFEWVYFSSAESTWKNGNMYEVRLKLGQALGQKIKELNLPIDIIAPVPDTSRSAGIALSETLNIPYREVLIKNRYVQRSFILNTDEKRKEAVNIKFSVVKELVQGKNILLVDDSIVRGTTSKKIVELIKSFGANKIYLASTCPPITHPCSYGIAFPSKEELVMNEMTTSKLAEYLGADDVIFTDLNDLKNALNVDDFCNGCLTGDYPYERSHI